MKTMPSSSNDQQTADQPSDAVESTVEGAPAGTAEQAAADERPTLGVPGKTRRRRTTKPDAVLAEATDLARAGVLEITDETTIGAEHLVRGEEDRLSTHLFECSLKGYRGWYWFATLSRVPRSKTASVCEVGLIPGDDALLAPEWVPWAERLRPEDIAAEKQRQQEENGGGESAPETAPSASDQQAAAEPAQESAEAVEKN